MSAPLVYDELDVLPEDAVALLGGKAAQLLQLQKRGYPVPPFFVLSTAALRQILGDPPEAANNPEAMRRLLEDAEMTPQMKSTVVEAHKRWMPPNAAVAVRSSAVTEDGCQHSFAGIYDTILGVCDPDSLIEAIKQVWISAMGPRAVAYRKQLGLPPNDVGMAVIVQVMVDARRSGVCFTCHPTTGASDELIIHSVLGVGEGLVGHGLPADSFVVSKPTFRTSTELSEKSEQFLVDPQEGGLRRVAVSKHEQNRPSLSEEQVQQVARAALAIESDCGAPQDIEFCFDADVGLHILQARPVTTRAPASSTSGPAAGNLLVWDNSNIIESYSGITTPMTFSFIRRAYSIVYHCFAEVMGISPREVHKHRDAFDNMLGLFRGRVYYNLKNWYRLVQLFPGYQYNRRFMESMMGLNDPLVLEGAEKPPGLLRRWFVELPALSKLLTRSGTNFLFIRRKVDGFERHFQEHFGRWSKVDFDDLPPHEVMAAYTTLEGALLWNWKAPIINDFYVMVFYGVLKSMCTSWCSDTTGALQNGLICGEGGLQSDEPAKMMLQMAGLVHGNETLRRLVLEEQVEALPALIAGDPRFAEFNTLMTQYLEEYGLRCVGELKLEECSYNDRPDRLYQILRDYLRQEGAPLHHRGSIERREHQVRADAERQCLVAISHSQHGWLRRRLFQRVLRNARLGIRNRENMRFARTRIYGILRRMLRSIGKHFATVGVLDDREDVFYLTLDEVWDFLKGTAVSTNLRELAALRRAEYDRYRDGSVPAPEDRFVTYGMAYHGNHYRDSATPNCATKSGLLVGIGCCPGIVDGQVQVIRDPAQCQGFQGQILVAERTDPGWVPIYPAFSGILIERGSVLSHSAIVAREMGIPTIVGISGLTAQLQSGQRVRMDGRTGRIELLDAE